MRFYLDTEFLERGRDYPVQLISLAIVGEHGRGEYYAHSSEYDVAAAGENEWLRENVLPHVQKVAPISLGLMKRAILEFIGDDKPEFWGYYCDYDWVVFCQIFGRMIDLPKGFPMYCRDLKQLVDSVGNPRLPKNDSHNALVDARWVRDSYHKVRNMCCERDHDFDGNCDVHRALGGKRL